MKNNQKPYYKLIRATICENRKLPKKGGERSI